MILSVTSPNSQRTCEGIYRLAFDIRGNGMPVWRHVLNDRVLFSSTSGKWYIRDSKAEKCEFQGPGFYLSCSKKHNGKMPHEVTCCWRAGYENTCQSDADIKVSAIFKEEQPYVPKSLPTPMRNFSSSSGTSVGKKGRSTSPRKRNVARLRALMLDFDATLTVVEEIPRETREQLLRDPSSVDFQRFQTEVFGGKERVQALSTMLRTACSNGVIPHIASLSDSPLIERALELVRLQPFFQHRVFGYKEIRMAGNGDSSSKARFIRACAEVEGWRRGEVLFVDDQQGNLQGTETLCKTMMPAGQGLNIKEINRIASATESAGMMSAQDA